MCRCLNDRNVTKNDCTFHIKTLHQWSKPFLSKWKLVKRKSLPWRLKEKLLLNTAKVNETTVVVSGLLFRNPTMTNHEPDRDVCAAEDDAGYRSVRLRHPSWLVFSCIEDNPAERFQRWKESLAKWICRAWNANNSLTPREYFDRKTRRFCSRMNTGCGRSSCTQLAGRSNGCFKANEMKFITFVTAD